MKVSIIKKLSRNDLGLTGGHQAGICVPKTVIAKEFFPQLKAEQYNPRVVIPMYFEKDRDDVNFIFYNNKLICFIIFLMSISFIISHYDLDFKRITS